MTLIINLYVRFCKGFLIFYFGSPSVFYFRMASQEIVQCQGNCMLIYKIIDWSYLWFLSLVLHINLMVVVWRLRGNIIRTVLYIANVLPLQWAQLTKTVHTVRLGLEFVFLYFLGCMICLYVGVCFVLPWTVESLPFMLWRWHNKHKWAPFELFAPSSLLRVRSWLHPFKCHCEQKAMRDEGAIYVAGHPLLNRRCTRLPWCFYFPKCKL